MLALVTIVGYTAGTLSILWPIFVREALGAGPLAYGWILTAQAVGEGITNVVLGNVRGVQGRWGQSGWFASYWVLGGLALILIPAMPSLLPVLLLSLLFGSATTGLAVQILITLQQRVPGRLAGR